MKKRTAFSFFLLAGVLLLTPIPGSSQDIDPFYLSLVEKAQKSFLAKNYADAARDFEIAAFGLAGDKTLQAKNYVYLSLCRYYLKDMQASERSLHQAADIVGEEGFGSLEIYESAWPDLNKLIAFFNLTRAQSEAPPKEIEKPGPPPDPLPPPAASDDTAMKPNSKTAKNSSQGSAKNPEKKPPAEPPSDPPVEIKLDQVKEGDVLSLELVETPPVVIKRIPAAYPEHARRLGIEGTVVISVLVSEKGDVVDAEIIQGIKNAAGFDQAALQAARRWKFEPATVRGIKVKVWISVAIEFKKQPRVP
jgi:protein TonB